jgi:hypothetical protein
MLGNLLRVPPVAPADGASRIAVTTMAARRTFLSE